MAEQLGKLKQENARDIAASNATRSLRLINNPGLDERTKGEALSRLRADFFNSFLKSSVGGKVETRTYSVAGGRQVDVSGVALGPDVHIWNVAGLDAALDRGYFRGDAQREQELNNIRDRYVWGVIDACFKNERSQDVVDARLVNIVRSGASRDAMEQRIRQEILGGNMSPVRGAEGYILEEYKEWQEAQQRPNNNAGPDNRGNNARNQGGRPDASAGKGAGVYPADEDELFRKLVERMRSENRFNRIRAGGTDPMSLGSEAAMEAADQIGQLTGTSPGEVMSWAVQTLDLVAREPLFFAGAGWQQFGPYMEREVRKVFTLAKKGEREKKDAIEIIRAVLAPRLYEEAMMHCDGALSILVKTLPQAGIFDSNEYNTSRRELLLANPLIDYFYNEVYDRVEQDPKNTLGMIADAETSNIMAEELARSLTGSSEKYRALQREYGEVDEGLLQCLAREAVAIFNVDSMPDVIMWANKNAGKVHFEGLVDNIKTGRRINSDRVRGDVVVYDTMFNRTLNYSHPLVSLRRPVDVYRANNVWNERLLSEAEQALWSLGEHVFLKTEKNGDQRFKRWSEIGIKTLDRWDAMMSGFFGGTQAENLDNFNDLEKGLDKLQKIIQNDVDMPDIGGSVAAKVIKVKVMALLAENRHGFSANMMRAMAVQRSSVPKELSDALGRMTGSGMDASFGTVKEAVARLGFNFVESVDMAQAIDMLVTESRDPAQAGKNANIKRAAMFLKAILDLSSESSGGGGKKK